MKHLIDFHVPLYAVGTHVVHIPTSGKIKQLGIDPQNPNDWFVSVEQETGDGYSRPVEFRLDYETAAVESAYDFVGKIELPHGRYHIWSKEVG